MLIIGAGAVGLLCAHTAKISGASSIIMVDVGINRLWFAALQGLADKTLRIPFHGEEGESSADFVARMAGDVVQRTRQQSRPST